MAQGSPREDLPGSPQSPIHNSNRNLTSHPKYQASPHSSRLQPTIISPQATSVTDGDCSDSNSALAYPPPEYPVFLHSYSADEPYYQPPAQEMFYPYSDSEITQHHLLNASQQRPFSASSSSCSSSESEHIHLQNIHSGAYSADPHFNVNCFNNNQSSAQAQNWHGHEFKSISHQTHSAGYTSVIVDTQQYQLANEYVH